MPSPVRTPEHAPPLIFQWKRERGVKRRLAMWILVVAAGHAALFYLFRVSPPLASRKPPPQQSVLYLPPGEPGVQELLSALDDRYPGAVVRSEDYTLASDMAALAKAVPPVAPSWDARRAALKPFLQPVVPQDLPALFQPGEPLLPSVASSSSPPPPAGPGSPNVPLVVVDSGGAARTIISQPRWPEKLMDDWPDSGNVPFMLGVGRDGTPEYCLPLSPAIRIDLETLRRALLTTRFNQATTGGLEWITVAIRW
jgi:hypothetical protein